MAQEMIRRHPPLRSLGSLSTVAAVITTAFFFFLLQQLPQQLQAAAVNSSRRGLSLNLVHRDSIHSPSYPGPLTDLQRLERTIRFSRFPPVDDDQVVAPLSDTDTSDICGIAPPVSSNGGFYLVTLAMGTPKKVFWLVLDTGSDLTWTQCVPSDPQFRQAHPLFDPAVSSSFRYIDPAAGQECEMPSKPSGRYCTYTLTYESGESTSGMLGLETFHFYAPRGPGGILSFRGLTFGCSHKSVGRNFDDSLDGVLGMGNGPLSFAAQVGAYYDGRFSYCLSSYDPQEGEEEYSPYSLLLFGDDIHMVGDVQTTPFLANSPTHYHLTLEDITLSAGLSLGLNAEVYKPDERLRRRGTIIDSGAVGFLYDPVFDALKEIMTAYFGLFDYTPFDMSSLSSIPLEICYEDTKPFSLREDMFLTYRFRGPALLQVPSKYLFDQVRDHQPPYFCLSMRRNKERTLIGFWQQRDVRFTFDLVEEVIHFVPETCDPSSGED